MVEFCNAVAENDLSIKADGRAALDDGERLLCFTAPLSLSCHQLLSPSSASRASRGKFGKQIIGDEARNDGSEPEMIRD